MKYYQIRFTFKSETAVVLFHELIKAVGSLGTYFPNPLHLLFHLIEV
jgi:hypothetical protein